MHRKDTARTEYRQRTAGCGAALTSFGADVLSRGGHTVKFHNRQTGL